MKKQNILRSLFALIVLTAFISGVKAYAEDIKSRMAARLPMIVELKAAGVVGENSSGYLDFVGAAREKADVVAAENSDRSSVYEAIAKQQGTSADFVGSRRAQQIAENAGAGDWLQDASGKWSKK